MKTYSDLETLELLLPAVIFGAEGEGDEGEGEGSDEGDNDEGAGIFSQADYGVKADLYEFVPALIARLPEPEPAPEN